MAPEDPVTVSPPPPPPPPTPSLKTKIARRFVKSLAEVWTSRKLATEGGVRKRARRIKIAAYSSMARAVGGSRRAWSRALLAKLQGRAKRRCHLRSQRCLGLKRKRAGSRNMVRNEVSGSDKLRRLVPGGKAMDLCNLLEETSHFVQCLATQVKVMQSIADRYSV
ncbi:transcription factor IBH1-like [Rhodamnia argentea]|uniref:Transcription factor IBH1-like n=1 Tax=Rhodamnia argentea TaxID=178133 RepID=A0ABM3GWU3_9MYRT|nr:transcription factor IBH1-like [Rhodamnia argentea]XP_048128833.1 transcription factor IBH1-like [Rhodamnia argentea]